MISIFELSSDFPFTPYQQVETVSLICLRKIGAMDTVRVEVNLRPEEAAAYLMPGSPMRVTWRGGDRPDEFVGYVHSLKPAGDGYLPKTIIIGVSAAYPLFNESARAFYQASIHNVAEEIADDYRFQLDTDPHPLIQNQILQQDESDWGMLRRLGDEWGYALVMDGVRLIFRPLLKVLEENDRVAVPVLSPEGPQAPSVLKNFEPNYSAVTDKAPLARYVGSGLDPYGLRPLPWEEESGGIFKKTTTTRAVASELEGEMVAASEEAKARFPFTARGTVMYPGGAKPLDVYRIMHNNQISTWTVHAVKHIVTGNNYIADMVFGSNGEDTGTSRDHDRVDVNLRLERSHMRPAEPVIANYEPYYAGRGANVANKNQRWVARLINTTPVTRRTDGN